MCRWVIRKVVREGDLDAQVGDALPPPRRELAALGVVDDPKGFGEGGLSVILHHEEPAHGLK